MLGISAREFVREMKGQSGEEVWWREVRWGEKREGKGEVEILVKKGAVVRERLEELE